MLGLILISFVFILHLISFPYLTLVYSFCFYFLFLLKMYPSLCVAIHSQVEHLCLFYLSFLTFFPFIGDKNVLSYRVIVLFCTENTSQSNNVMFFSCFLRCRLVFLFPASTSMSTLVRCLKILIDKTVLHLFTTLNSYLLKESF